MIYNGKIIYLKINNCVIFITHINKLVAIWENNNDKE